MRFGRADPRDAEQSGRVRVADGSERELHLAHGVAASDAVPYVAASPPRTVSPGREILFDGPKFVLERWRGSGRGTLRSGNRPTWLIPLSGNGVIDESELLPGSVWISDGDTSLTLQDSSDVLLAYPKCGVIENPWS